MITLILNKKHLQNAPSDIQTCTVDRVLSRQFNTSDIETIIDISQSFDQLCNQLVYMYCFTKKIPNKEVDKKYFDTAVATYIDACCDDEYRVFDLDQIASFEADAIKEIEDTISDILSDMMENVINNITDTLSDLKVLVLL